MSKRSEAVKSWRKRTKARIIEAFGGECCLCGYFKCTDALELHHLDPNEKDFSLGGARASPKSWDKLVIELRKCVLLCANCHREVHAGIAIIPNNVSRFDESFSSYNEKKVKYCKVCNSPYFTTNKHTCSVACHSSYIKKFKSKVDWDSIDLLEELKCKTRVQIAKELGVSETAVRKRLKKISNLFQGDEMVAVPDC